MNLDLERCRQQWCGLGAPPPASASAAAGRSVGLRRPFGYGVLRAGEVVFAALAAVATAAQVPAHVGAAWELVVVLTTVACAVAWVGSSGRRFLAWRQLRCDVPVVLARRAVLRLQHAEARATLWALAIGVCWWLPTALLAVEIVGGPSWLGVVDGAWFAANLVFGLLGAVGLHRFARRRLRAFGATEVAGQRDRWLELLGGATLAKLAAELAELAVLAPEAGADATAPRRNTPPTMQ